MLKFTEAEWIWAKGYDRINTYVGFEDELCTEEETGYTVLISVDTNYCIYINGKIAATGQYADYPFDKVYDTISLDGFLEKGRNQIRIHCWHQGYDTSTIRGETAGLIYEIYKDGNSVLHSTAKVKSYVLCEFDMDQIESVSGQLGMTFRYDSTRERSAAITETVTKPMPKRLRPIKKLVIGDDKKTVMTARGSFTENGGDTIGKKMQYCSMAVKSSSPRYELPSEEGILLEADEGFDGIFAVFDLSEESNGILSLDFDVPEECDVLIGWGEHLEDLRVRAYVGTRNFCAKYHAHAGRNVFVNPFRRLGLRYLQINVYTKSTVIRYAGIKTTDYPLEHEAVFTCADSLHNRIYEVAKHTLKMCMHEHYEDCPWREQALYSMDSRNQMLCGYYAFREYNFAKSSLRLIAQSLREDKTLELCSPARVFITIPAFTAIFLTQVYEYTEHSGDIAFISEILPVLFDISDEFIRRMDEDALIRCYPEAKYWNFYEWQSGLEGAIGGSVSPENLTADAPLMAFVSMGLQSFAKTLALAGRENESCKYIESAERLNSSLNRYFWNDELGAYASFMDAEGKCRHYAELTNSLAVCCGAVPADRIDRVLEHLAASDLIQVTLSHSIFKYEALMRDYTKYSRTVFKDIAEKWGYMLYNNATTFWETIDGAVAFGDAGSLCHGWSAIPIYFYHEYALKLDPTITGLYECLLTDE